MEGSYEFQIHEGDGGERARAMWNVLEGDEDGKWCLTSRIPLHSTPHDLAVEIKLFLARSGTRREVF